jgi:oligosaccharide repeat unit polymerase
MKGKMKSLPLNKRRTLLHPFMVFSCVWFTVVFLYSLHLSNLLLYSTQEVVVATGYIWIPFLGVIALYTAYHHWMKLAYRPRAQMRVINLGLVERRLTIWFRLWVIVSIGEILISGGIPIIWIMQHNSKTYFDFGIHSLHGLANSLLVSVAVCRFALYLYSGERKHLKIPIFVLVWSLLVITRQLMLTALLEYAIIFLSIKVVRTRTVATILCLVLLLILIFGVVGDIRTGSEAFRSLAQPTAQYPDWLPSGVLWVYIYVTTPINNLLYTMHSFHPLSSLLFPNTLSSLFPSVLHTLIYGDQGAQVENENLVTQAFNVSTAYVGPFEDYGLLGIVLFSSLTAFVCQFFWYRPTLRDLLIFSVLTQCLVLTLFSNLFFLLPVISQIIWLFYFFMPEMHIGKEGRTLVCVQIGS